MRRKSTQLPEGAPNTEQAAPSGGVVASIAPDAVEGLSRRRPVPVARRLAGRTQQYKSTVLRLLASLQQFGFIQRDDDGRYAWGPKWRGSHACTPGRSRSNPS